LADLSTDIPDETGEFIHAMPYPAGSYDERTPLMHEIRTGGIDLWNWKPPRFCGRRASFSPRRAINWTWCTTPTLAGLHAAQALIFERTSKVIKRHRGVQNELRWLTKDEPRFDLELRAFLGRTYNLKAIANYETGPASEVTVEKAQQAIETARHFVACLRSCWCSRRSTSCFGGAAGNRDGSKYSPAVAEAPPRSIHRDGGHEYSKVSRRTLRTFQKPCHKWLYATFGIRSPDSQVRP
jgi:hypothetical protein